MRRRLAIVAGALAIALAMPLASASADSLFPTTGAELSTVSETLCDNGLCTYVQVNAFDGDGGSSVCVTINHITEEFGTVYEIENGCVAFAVSGDPVYTSGFMTGVTATTIHVTSELGERDVTIASTNAITSTVIRSNEKDSVVSDGCTYFWSSRNRQVQVTGTVTLNGVTFTDEGGSLNRDTKLRPHC